MIKDFNGKVAVITGGASGIGLGLAKAFTKRGMKLVLADINKDALEKVSKEFGESNVEIMTVITDVSDPEQVAHLADVSYERYGHVDILCNNAGIGAGGPIRFLSREDWNWTLNVNLNGVFYGIQSFLNRMISSRKPCHIINTSSLAGLTPGDSAAYSASKAALIALSESLALECFGTNVRVSVICPAHVRSNIMENSEILSRERSGAPPSELGTPSSEAENAKKLLELGMDPEFMAELVIKAIEEDIFYIITHPEYLPLIKARFERMHEDTIKIYEDLEDQKIIKTKSFKNDSPAFTVTYPDYFIELRPNPMMQALFFASFADRNLEISVSKITPNTRLEDVSKRILATLKFIATDIELISDKPTNLKDGTPAYETTIECKIVGMFRTRMVNLSVIKDESSSHTNLVRVVLTGATNNFDEELKDILYSLEFQ